MKDPNILLGLYAMLPLLKTIEKLMKFAQMQDVFICDFVGALHKCQGMLFEFYIDDEIAFKHSDFYAFNDLLICNHEQIFLSFQTDINWPEQELDFFVGTDVIMAKHEGQRVTRSNFATMVDQIREEYKGTMMAFLFAFVSHFLNWFDHCSLRLLCLAFLNG